MSQTHMLWSSFRVYTAFVLGTCVQEMIFIAPCNQSAAYILTMNSLYKHLSPQVFRDVGQLVFRRLFLILGGYYTYLYLPTYSEQRNKREKTNEER